MAEKHYIDDPYRAECPATVTRVRGRQVFLTETVCYPEGGGQVGDTGWVGASRTNEVIAKDLEIKTEPVAGEPEARIWRSGDMTIPCGGTHVRSTGEIGRVTLRRKRQGNHLERLYITTAGRD